MSPVLIGLITCARDRAWLAACQDTWLKDLKPGFDWIAVDESFLPQRTRDTYDALPLKTKRLCQYAHEKKYRSLLKVDNDTYLRAKLLQPPREDYVGRYRGPSGGYPAHFCSGGAYWLSARAIEIIANADLTKDKAEDRWVGNVLLGFGIKPHHLKGYVAPTHSPVTDYMHDPECVALMQIETPEQMRRAHAGIFDPPARPAGSDASHFPAGSTLRRQMREGVEAPPTYCEGCKRSIPAGCFHRCPANARHNLVQQT